MKTSKIECPDFCPVCGSPTGPYLVWMDGTHALGMCVNPECPNHSSYIDFHGQPDGKLEKTAVEAFDNGFWLASIVYGTCVVLSFDVDFLAFVSIAFIINVLVMLAARLVYKKKYTSDK